MRFVTVLAAAFAVAISQAMSQIAEAAAIKVVSGGAFKQVLAALAAQYQRQSGDTLDITYRTVGQHLALIRDGKEDFDVAILTPEAIENLAKEGKIVPGTRADLAKTGVGVVVKAGAPLPDIATVEAFKRTLLAAKSVAFIDPKAGGSSGIYVERLLGRLGIADQINAKAVLVQGGAVADHIADGRSRDRYPPDQRNLAGGGDDVGRSIAGGNSELHGLFGGRRRRGQGRRQSARAGQVPVGPACLADHQGQGHGAGGRPENGSARPKPGAKGRYDTVAAVPRISGAPAPRRCAECPSG